MSIAAPASLGLPPPPPYPVRRFTVAEYHQMIDVGLLTEDDPVELLEGWIVPKMPRSTAHDVAIDKSEEAIRKRLPAGRRLRVQSAVSVGDSEPEPDIALVPGPAERYLAHHPQPDEIDTLIEVADSSLERDRRDKGRLYSRVRIKVYWIINLVDRQVEIYSDPTGPDASPCFRQRRDFGPGDAVPLVIDGAEVATIPVAELLP